MGLTIPPVVDLEWVREHRDGLVFADVRWYLDGRSGYDAYRAGHLPGAIWVDVDTDLSAPSTFEGGRHPLLAPAEFAAALGELGIAETDTVIAYDDNCGAYAARLVWLLRRLGQDAALLDGGLAGWPHPLETDPVTRTPVHRRVVPWPDVFRTADEVAVAAATGKAVVLDARAPQRYSGESVLPTDRASGHIPGAVNAPWAENLDESGRFAPDLRARYAARGVTGGLDVIVYCGSGVTACHDLLALELFGVTSAALYPGSWSAWSADPSRPIATGEGT